VTGADDEGSRGPEPDFEAWLAEGEAFLGEVEGHGLGV
jgi:hypothetical protein